MTLPPESPAPEHPPEHLAAASVTISGDTLDPEFWTGYFGVKPSMKVKKDEPFVTPSGRLSRTPGRIGMWGVSSKHAVRDDELDRHISYLIGMLRLPREGLADLLLKRGEKMRFLCYWVTGNGTRIPDVSQGLQSIIHTCGATLVIDKYW